MERRALLAIALAVGVLVIWQVIFPPPPPPERPPVPETAAPVEAESPAAPEPVSPPAGAAPLAAAVGESEGRILTARTESALVMFTNRGGRIMSWKLTGYKDHAGRNLELIPESGRAADLLPLGLRLDNEAATTAANSAFYRMEKSGLDDSEVVLEWADGAGLEVKKTVRIGPGFAAEVSLDVRRHGQPVASELTWGAGFGEEGANGGGANRFSYSGRSLLQAEPKPQRLEASALEGDQAVTYPAGRLWGGLEDTYFTALFLPGEDGGPFRLRRAEIAADGGEAATRPALVVSTELAGDGSAVDLFVGPKDYQILRAAGRRLEEAVHFQSGIWVIGPLVTLLTRGLFHALIFLHTQVVANWGWAIVLLTMFIKLIFWPITNRSMLSMKRMQEKTKKMQPKIAAIKERYRRAGKKDIESRQKMNQETMAVYQKAGINPMGNLGGCLPLLLQLPILYGFYNLLQVAIELRQAPFGLWVNDLSAMDPYYVLPIIMGGSMIAQQVLTGMAIADPMQRRMMYMTPVLFTVFFLQLPSGLVLYWLVNNLLGILQQYFINRRFALESANPAPAGRVGADRKAKA